MPNSPSILLAFAELEEDARPSAKGNCSWGVLASDFLGQCLPRAIRSVVGLDRYGNAQMLAG